jgi:hypothetical protein
VSCAVARNSESALPLSGVLARTRIDRQFSWQDVSEETTDNDVGEWEEEGRRKKAEDERNRIRVRIS